MIGLLSREEAPSETQYTKLLWHRLQGWEHFTPVVSSGWVMSSEAPGVSVGPAVGTKPGSAQWEELGTPAAPSCPHPKHSAFTPNMKKAEDSAPRFSSQTSGTKISTEPAV